MLSEKTPDFKLLSFGNTFETLIQSPQIEIVLTEGLFDRKREGESSYSSGSD